MLSELEVKQRNSLHAVTLKDQQFIKSRLGLDLNLKSLSRASDQIKILTKLIRKAGEEFSDVILRRHSNPELEDSVFFSIGIYSSNQIENLSKSVEEIVNSEMKTLKSFKTENDMYSCIKFAYEIGLKLDGGPTALHRAPNIIGGEMEWLNIFDSQAREIANIEIKIPFVVDVRGDNHKIDVFNGDIFSPEMVKIFKEKAFESDPICAKSFNVSKDADEYSVTLLTKSEKCLNENSPLRRLYSSKTEIEIKKIYK